MNYFKESIKEILSKISDESEDSSIVTERITSDLYNSLNKIMVKPNDNPKNESEYLPDTSKFSPEVITIIQQDDYYLGNINEESRREIVKYAIVNQFPISKILDLATGIKLYQPNFLYTSIKSNNYAMVEYLIEFIDINADDNLAISLASRGTSPEIISLLIKNGADINANNSQPIRNAIDSKNINFEIVKMLIENGSDIHVENDYPLKIIAGTPNYLSKENYPILQYLLKKGANVNASEGWPLTMTIVNKNHLFAEELLKFGANPNVLSWRVLFSTIMYPEMLNLLVTYKADFTVINSICESESEKLVNKLEELGVEQKKLSIALIAMMMQP